ncbi:MAG: RNase adapter RapZ [Actinobacteria bacterium]|nr:RNase adapter RapZ [Actinomycetota bacterium]
MDQAAIDAPHVLVVTGLSGAGRSTAAKILEDLDYVVIDNLPPALLEQAVKSHDIPNEHKHLAVVIDSRGGLPMEEIKQAMIALERDSVVSRIVFLDADDDVIVGRYEENRRPHPLGMATITQAIAAERGMLEELREMADVIIDTSSLNVHELRQRMTDLFSESQAVRPTRVSIRSFGFKHGVPRDLDLLFDVRFLPNPHWVPELRDQVGTDPDVREYVLGADGAKEFLDRVDDLLEFLLPRFQAEAKSYLSIGIGCTGGHHRSVAIAEELASRLSRHGVEAAVVHRDVTR